MRTLLVLLLAPALATLAACRPPVDESVRSRQRYSDADRGVQTSSAPTASRDATASMGAASAPVPGPGAAASVAAAPSPALDARITSQVQAQIAHAHDLGHARIDVDTRDGVVTLSGAVPSAAIKARASEIARTVPGVVEVNDQLTLATS